MLSTTIISITGKLIEAGEIYTLPDGRIKCQRITIAVDYNDARMKSDFFTVFIYGQKEIAEAWSGYNDKDPPKSATIQCKLNGRMNNSKNHLTLTLKKIIWNYY